MTKKTPLSHYTNLIEQISGLLQEAKSQVIRQINTTMVQTYRNIGKYIVEFEQWWVERAEYGKELVKRISQDLTEKFWKGFSERNLRRIKQFYLAFPNSANDVGRIQNVGWSKIDRIMHLKDPDEQKFYLIEASREKRSRKELDRQINSALYERLVLSKDKDTVMKLAKEGEIIQTSKDLVRDPYILEFLGLKADHTYTEKDLETAIINNLQMFLLEMGKGFSFVARQRRMRTDIEDYYVDLVFYNRILQCHLLIDLKIWKLTHQDVGQMQMYVNYYNREIKLPHENPTVWLILCKENNDIALKYTLSPEQENIFAKEYKLYLPEKKELKQYLDQHLGTIE